MTSSGATPLPQCALRLPHFRLQVLVHCTLSIDRTWRHDLQSHFWRLYRFSGNGAALLSNERRLEMQPDRTYLVPAFVRFGTSSRAAMTHDYMHFDVHGLLPGWLKRVFTTPLLLPNDDVVDGLVSLWQADLARGAATTLGGFSRALALAHAAFAQALEGVSVSRREELQRWLVSEPDLLPALELIERRLARPPQNDELAALCHMGVRHFVRRFKVSTGLTPVQFGLERRILEAASWLSQSDRTIEDIATTTGFTDRFYFSKMFKARLGSSPARYRMEHRRERGD